MKSGGINVRRVAEIVTVEFTDKILTLKLEEEEEEKLIQ